MREKILSSSSKFINKKNFVLNHLNKNLNQFYNYFSSKFLILKKGFTLVELSIVLLVLALLVSTLLVGRQIIDRAKVQQITSEIDYYTKNFQMFRDQYDFLPGALDEKNCRKYPEFALQKPMHPNQYSSQCDDPDSMFVEGESNVYRSFKQANFSMVDMVASAMVENRSPGERVRKHFDIADTTETTTISMPYCIGNQIVWDTAAELKDILKYLRFVDTDAPITDMRNFACGGYGTSGEWVFNSGQVLTYYSPSGASCNYWQSINANDLFSKLGNVYYSSESRGYHAYQKSTGDMRNCGGFDQYWKMIKVTASGCSYINSKIKRTVSETKTIPGEKRRGYLLKQAEIENQANRSVFDADVWVSYSGGKVHEAYTYGVDQSAMTIAQDNNTIVFFKFDPNKSEVNADGALSYNIFNLLQKKLGEASTADSFKIGNLHATSKSDGEGFNFIYVMR